MSPLLQMSVRLPLWRTCVAIAYGKVTKNYRMSLFRSKVFDAITCKTMENT